MKFDMSRIEFGSKTIEDTYLKKIHNLDVGVTIIAQSRIKQQT